MEAQRWSRGVALLFLLTSALGGECGQCHAIIALSPGKRSGTHCTGG